MDGYFDVVDGAVVWRPFADSTPDILPREIHSDGAIFEVVSRKVDNHNEVVRLPDVGRFVMAVRSIG